MSSGKPGMKMNTDDFNLMREMLSEIEMKIIQVDPWKQFEFYKFMRDVIYEAWVDACNPEDTFLYND